MVGFKLDPSAIEYAPREETRKKNKNENKTSL